jgi:hypothetical protein
MGTHARTPARPLKKGTRPRATDNFLFPQKGIFLAFCHFSSGTFPIGLLNTRDLEAVLSLVKKLHGTLSNRSLKIRPISHLFLLM